MERFKLKKDMVVALKAVYGNKFANFIFMDKDEDGWYFEVIKTGISSIESPCAVVHSIAGKMQKKPRGEVIKACMKAGVTYYTARTQYQVWSHKKAA